MRKANITEPASPLRRRFYMLALPAAFVLLTLSGFAFPGDEYALWFISALAGSWICLLLPNIGSPAGVVPFVALAGAAVMTLLGRGLDHCQVSKRLWLGLVLVAAALFVAGTALSFPSVERAIAKNGSFAAYLFNGLNLSCSLGSALALLAGWARRA